MEKFNIHCGKVIPLPIKNVDTDMILPAQYMTSISKGGYGVNLFRRLRDQNPDFPLNQPKYQGGSILVADHNFACGSSREHAVWALLQAGIKVVISSNFADIFFNNSAKNGLLSLVLKQEDVDYLIGKAKSLDGYELTVDLPSQRVSDSEGFVASFEIDAFKKHCFIEGMDELDYLLNHMDEIEAYKARTEVPRFFSTLNPNR